MSCLGVESASRCQSHTSLHCRITSLAPILTLELTASLHRNQGGGMWGHACVSFPSLHNNDSTLWASLLGNSLCKALSSSFTTGSCWKEAAPLGSGRSRQQTWTFPFRGLWDFCYPQVPRSDLTHWVALSSAPLTCSEVSADLKGVSSQNLAWESVFQRV